MRHSVNKMEQSFKEKYFYAYKLLNDCLPIYALYAVLFREKGLSLTEISLLFSLWSFVALVSEVPSGVLADRWNRKYLICIAVVLKSICFIIWYFSDTFFMFGAGFVFWGIAGSFTSGTEEGLVYDNLKSESRENEFTKIYGKGRFFSSLGVIAGVVSGGILAYFIPISVISIMSALILVVCFLFALQLKEKNYYSDRLKKEKSGYFKTLFEATGLCVKNSKIFIGMILLVFIFGITGYSDEYDALIISDFGLDYIWLSIIFGIRFICIAIGSRFADAVDKKINIKNKTFLLGSAGGVFLLFFSRVWNSHALVIFGIFCMFITIAEIIQINIVQGEINEEGRATVMSLLGVCQNIAMILFSLTYAALSNGYRLKTLYAFISLYCIAGTALLFFINTMVKKRRTV